MRGAEGSRNLAPLSLDKGLLMDAPLLTSE
jgi:hypothetical protein